MKVNADESTRLADLLSPVIVAGDARPGTAVRVHVNTKLVSLERFKPQPSAMFRSVEFADAEEFKDYCERFGDAEDSAGFATLKPLRVRYVLDYGTDANPKWGVHKADFCPVTSPQFNAWQAAQKKPFTHSAFAEFIEEHLADIVQPDSATMLEVATSFQATGSTQFSSAVRTQNGDVQFNFAREVRGSTKAGQCEVPSVFIIRVPIYEFHAPLDLTARLRYRINDGALAIWYEFARLEEVLAVHDMTLLEEIRERVTRVSLGKIVKALQPVVTHEE